MLPLLEQMLVSADAKLYEGLKVITKNAQGICFVVRDNRLVGTLTDGDIRKFLLKGETLESEISKAMNSNPTSLPVETPNLKIREKLSSTIGHIPLVDEDNVVVDYACLHRYRRTPVMEPLLDGNELAYVTECIQTNWISSQGGYIKQFEKMFYEGYQMADVLAVSNGTAALHLALEALGLGQGDEVIVPDFTFAASINAIIYTGATPVLVDVTEETWTMDPVEVRKAITPKTKAIMPVHIYGHPCDMDAIEEIANEHELLIVADAAEALGSRYKDRPVASIGDAVVFSFFGNKTITTGEGGIVLFKDAQVGESARILRDHGMSKQKRYWHEMIGFNYRMTNLQAAVGVAQMERLDHFIDKKRGIASSYKEQLSEFSQFTMPPEAEWASSTYWLFTLLFNEMEGISRDRLIKMLLKNGVETRPTFYPIHQMPPYQKYKRDLDFPNSRMISQKGISLPSSVVMTPEEVKRISGVFRSIFQVREMVNGNSGTSL